MEPTKRNSNKNMPHLSNLSPRELSESGANRDEDRRAVRPQRGEGRDGRRI
jgi:hypothetical protein